MVSLKEITSPQTPQVPEPKMDPAKTTKPPKPPKSAQHCLDFLNRRCKRVLNGGCPYKHDEALLTKKTDERLGASRDKLQAGYTKRVSKVICKNYLENCCNHPSCHRTHDIVRHLQFMHKAREYIYNAFIKLETEDNTTAKDAGADTPTVVTRFCYYYNTGARCSRNFDGQCPFEHDIRLRRAVIKDLGGKNLSEIIVSNAEAADKTRESVKAQTFPGSEFELEKVSAGKNTTISTTSKVWDQSKTTSTEIDPKKAAATRDATALTTTSKALVTNNASQPTGTSKKPRYKNRKAFQKVPISPYPADDESEPIPSNTVQGGWTESPWWTWAKKNMKTAQELEKFKEYIPELEAGRMPKALRQKWSNTASKDAEFKYFGLFPFEIRQMIWKYAVKNERSTLRLKFSYGMEFGRKSNIKITNHNSYPAMFYVTSQSRQVAIKDYEVRFGTKHNPANTYFNYKRDRIFFQTKTWDELSYMARHMALIDASLIRHLCLPIRDFICGDEMITCDTLPFFVNMRVLTLFASDGAGDAKILSPSGVKFHMTGITGCVQTSWKRLLPGKPYPKVRLEWIDATLARHLDIDRLALKLNGLSRSIKNIEL